MNDNEVVYMYKGILFLHKKHPAIFHKMHEPGGCQTKWNKLDTEKNHMTSPLCGI